jgi:hypothetical protein
VSALTLELRRQLEASVLAARRSAEAASAAALESLGVFADRRPEHLSPDQSALRNGLRAKLRQLGRDRERLVAECGYEQWHQLLFARFLAENALLLHPDYEVSVTLADCAELAAELGETDAWAVAGRFAGRILPGIFRQDDPCVRLGLPPEGRHALEEILDGIPAATFIADDALGWAYQFWQRDKKDEVNDAEQPIEGADIGPVTQRFTEGYMVRFLLENSLGAWWAERHPDSPLLAEFRYLRRDEDGRPSSGPFEGWPDTVAAVTLMDPCCGSGHFLVEAFAMLWRMRAEEEGLDPVEAGDAVLRDNLFGLELDPRCVQIAMFAIALKAWKDGGRWRELPVPHVACSGVPVKAPAEEWTALAGDDERVRAALERLHDLFGEAETLGSLIDPRRTAEDRRRRGQGMLEEIEWEDLAPLVASRAEREAGDPASAVLGGDAASVARAADYLSRRYTLTVTNVPYLTAKRQGPLLRHHISLFWPLGKADLATAFLCRLERMSAGSYFAVTPENWLNLTSYTGLREHVTADTALQALVRLGPGAFGQVSGEVVKPILIGVAVRRPRQDDRFLVIDAIDSSGPEAKADALAELPIAHLLQADQRRHPDSRILLRDLPSFPPLSEVAECWAGIQTGDYPRFGRKFWEQPLPDPAFSLQQSTVAGTQPYGGREHALLWEGGRGRLEEFARENRERLHDSHRRGNEAWGHRGIVVSAMGDLPVTLYTGELFDNNVGVISPASEDLLAPLWHFCASDEFRELVRTIDNKMNVTNRTLAKVPFDCERWQRVADEAGPLPEPSSEDPTQWLFQGRPEGSAAPLQVAVARLLGYSWPQQVPDDLDVLADRDGIVCLPSVATEAPAAERLERLLAQALGETWSPTRARDLLEAAGSSKRTLAEWLRDDFFKQHCRTFDKRPFIWHVWDGRKDGFSALVNYHRLDRPALEKLTFTYLGQDWVERQRAGIADGVAGAEARLAAALELQEKLRAILQGGKPFDIYVRWKELQRQPRGWEPDLEDGVRVNIRPFVLAGVLRSRFSIHWKKDRGRNPDGSERINDRHLSLAEKSDAVEAVA